MKQLFTLCLLTFLGITNIIAQTPTISSFTPTTASVGSLVTITGTNLYNPTAITIGGVSALPISNTGSQLVAMVMPNATNGIVNIATLNGVVNASNNIIIQSSAIPNIQQGNKLLGTNSIGAARQGSSVAVSADGNTAIVGGYSDNGSKGAVWVYNRINNNWAQQGTKLVGSSSSTVTMQGFSVAISADGNTAIAGGYLDSSGRGALWIFSRSGNTWSQQGNKLLGIGNVGNAFQGYSVALSADGNTAIVGGFGDNNGKGAAWVFTRNGVSWSQQGNKLVGTGSAVAGGASHQGRSVAISADGNTAIVGADGDSSNRGAAWIFTRTGSSWSQQGSKLFGTGSNGAASQGRTVAINADGSIAIVGGPDDNSGKGAAWIYVKQGGVWIQQGSKLVSTDATSDAGIGNAVALNANGSTAILGGSYDNNGIGATWIFTQAGGIWSQKDNKLLGTAGVGASSQGNSVAISADGSTIITGGNLDNNNQGAAWVFTYKAPKVGTIINIVSCNSYTWAANGNKVYTESNNTDSVIYTNRSGEDSIVYLNLTINKSSSGTANVSVCYSYLWNDTSYTTSGTYTKTLTNSKGCDSVATLILTIKQGTSSTTTINKCSNDYPYLWNGISINSPGPYSVHLTNAAGCDSVATLNAIILNQPKSNVFYHYGDDLRYSNSSADNILLCGIDSTILIGNNAQIIKWQSSDTNIIKVTIVTPPANLPSSKFYFSQNQVVQIKAIAPGTATVSCIFNPIFGYCTPMINSTVTVGLTTPPPTITGPSNLCVNMPYSYNCNYYTGNFADGFWFADPTMGNMSSSGVFTPTKTGIVKIFYNTFGCAGLGNKSVTVSSIPAIGTSYLTKSTICSIGGTVIANNTNTNGGGIWTSSDSTIANPSNNASKASSVVTGLHNGTAILTYTKGTSGCSATANTIVTVAAVATLSSITGFSSICKGATVILNSTTGNGVWSSDNAYATVNSNGLVTGVNAGAAVIRYTVTNTYGCNASATENITINPVPSVPSIAYAAGTVNPQAGSVPTNAFCKGKTFTLVGSPIGGVWSATNPAVVSVTSGGLTTTVDTGTGSVVYTVTVNGCSNSKTIIGKVVKCGPRGVDNGQWSMDNGQWTMYPNPAHSSINLNVKTLVGAGSIVVTDLYGKQVKTQSLSMGSNNVDVSSLSKGFYLVSIITSEGKTTKKLIVE